MFKNEHIIGSDMNNYKNKKTDLFIMDHFIKIMNLFISNKYSFSYTEKSRFNDHKINLQRPRAGKKYWHFFVIALFIINLSNLKNI